MIILSLFDYTGRWCEPYVERGYDIIQVDEKLNMKVQELDVSSLIGEVHGILMAPPCTHFASSGARYWTEKDADGRTQEAVTLVNYCLALVAHLSPRFWALENPIGRLAKLVPSLGESKLTFDPCDYAGFADMPDTERFTKRTCLWGKFNTNLPKNYLPPVVMTRNSGQGSWLWLQSQSDERGAIRATTPQGFARAFAMANP